MTTYICTLYYPPGDTHDLPRSVLLPSGPIKRPSQHSVAFWQPIGGCLIINFFISMSDYHRAMLLLGFCAQIVLQSTAVGGSAIGVVGPL